VVAALALLLVALSLASPLSVSVEVSYAAEDAAAKAIVHITVVGSPNATYTVTVLDPAGGTVAVREVEVENGTAALELEIPDTYPPGTYTVVVSGDEGNATATFALSWNVSAQAPANVTAPQGRGAAAAAAALVSAAARLSQLAHCRNEVLASANVTETEYAALYQSALNLTAAADAYLALANESLRAGNYTTAFHYAQLALRSYGEALHLQEEVAEALNVSFYACRAVLAPPAAPKPLPAANVTCRWTPEFYPLMTAFDVAERRIEELEELLSRVQSWNLTGLENATAYLEEARRLVEEGRRLALSCNISAAAHRLAEAKRLIGRVQALVARAGAASFIRELRRAGVEVNESQVEELVKAVREGKAAKKVAELVNATVGRWRERLERKEVKVDEKVLKGLERLEKALEKVERSAARGRGLEKELERVQKAVEKIREELSRVRERVLEQVRERVRERVQRPGGVGRK